MNVSIIFFIFIQLKFIVSSVSHAFSARLFPTTRPHRFCPWLTCGEEVVYVLFPEYMKYWEMLAAKCHRLLSPSGCQMSWIHPSLPLSLYMLFWVKWDLEPQGADSEGCRSLPLPWPLTLDSHRFPTWIYIQLWRFLMPGPTSNPHFPVYNGRLRQCIKDFGTIILVSGDSVVNMPLCHRQPVFSTHLEVRST